LVAADAVKRRLLKDLEYEVQDTEDTREPLVFFDTQGGDYPERLEDAGEGETKKSILLGDSKSNEMEAAVVKMHVKNLIEAGVRDEDIAVVTPYIAQLAILSSILRETYPDLELGSVDGFQGREKEAVIVSLVRSNAEKEVGFLGEKRRLNGKCTRQHTQQSCKTCRTGEARPADPCERVHGTDARSRVSTSWLSLFMIEGSWLTAAVAMTRPKRHLCVIGDSETVSR